jgi:hypothetical protein
MAMTPFTGPNDPRLPKNFKPDSRFDPKSPGGPDLEGPGFRWLGNRRSGDGDHPGGHVGLLSAYLPGQQGALAQQFAQGFGGGLKQWNGILGQAYSNMYIAPNPLGYPLPDDNGKGKPGDTGDGKDVTGGDTDVPGIDTGHHNPAGQYLGAQMQSAGPMAQMAQSGQASPIPALAQGQMPAQTGISPLGSIQGPAQPNLMFGQQPISPQIAALLRQRLMGGQ